MATDGFARLLALKALKNGGGGSGGTGADGVGVAGSSVQYAVADNGTTPPANGWSSSIPTVPQGKYLWTKVTVTYTDGSNTISYSVSRNALDGHNGLDGKDGTNGQNGVDGKDGKDGIDGKSAYEIWLDNGHTGSEADFLNWLKGKDGVNGADGKDAPTITNIETESVIVEGDFTVNNLLMVLSDGTKLPFVVKAQNGVSIAPPDENNTTGVQYNALVDRVNDLSNALFVKGYDIMTVNTASTPAVSRMMTFANDALVPISQYEALETRVSTIEDLLNSIEGEILQVKEVDGEEDTEPVILSHTSADYVTATEYSTLEEQVDRLENIFNATEQIFVVADKGE